MDLTKLFGGNSGGLPQLNMASIPGMPQLALAKNPIQSQQDSLYSQGKTSCKALSVQISIFNFEKIVDYFYWLGLSFY